MIVIGLFTSDKYLCRAVLLLAFKSNLFFKGRMMSDIVVEECANNKRFFNLPCPATPQHLYHLFISDSIFISEPLPHSSDSDESDAETEDGSIHSVSSWASSVQVTADIFFFPFFSTPFSLSFSHSLNFPTFFFTLLTASFSSLFFSFYPCASVLIVRHMCI